MEPKTSKTELIPTFDRFEEKKSFFISWPSSKFSMLSTQLIKPIYLVISPPPPPFRWRSTAVSQETYLTFRHFFLWLGELHSLYCPTKTLFDRAQIFVGE